jgi:hypothetical protein
LLHEREANKEALDAASARFLRPAEPVELRVTYRGAFGPLKIEVDPEWIREMLPDCSPRPRRGRRLRKLLRLREEHNALIWAGRQISGIGPLVEERKRIEESWKRWQRKLVLWTHPGQSPGPPTQPYGPLRCSR